MIVSLILTVVIAFGSLAATMSLGWGPKLGLDLAGGLSVVYKPTTPASIADMQEVVTILSNRVNGLGVSGAQVNLQGKDVVVSVPGVHDARKVLQLVGETAQLLFRPVICQAAVGSKLAPLGKKALPACGATYQMTEANLAVTPANNVAGFTSNNLPPDPAFTDLASTQPSSDLPKDSVLLPLLGQPSVRYVLGPSELTGQSIKKAVAQQDQTGAWVVNYTLTSAGSPLWDKVASQNFHQLLAIELDGVVQSAPIIQPTQSTFTSFQGTGQISGSFSEGSAKNLALAMNFGALPVRLQALNTVTVSPTLGHSALIAGLGAGLAGLALVLLYTILYYRALGLVIVFGLIVTASLLWAIISALGHTAFAPSFDLAGVTGLIVSIGITVDSYVVYFERLKDEARAGRSVRSSVDRGFRSAWRTVLAADTVSLLAAVLLYIIAVGDVRGFAFFLGLSTIMDVVITWYFTRPLVILLGRRGSSSTSALSMAAGMQAGVASE
ncbi:MAG TPA: protein translocase subunit SecD [Acidimicrobiales bacterium]|nr:protein translocase subunit SecD [Acidimicrobiales bacterium]